MYDYIKILSVCITNENRNEKVLRNIKLDIKLILLQAPMNYIYVYICIFQLCVSVEDHISYETYPHWKTGRENVHIQLIKESREEVLASLEQTQIHRSAIHSYTSRSRDERIRQGPCSRTCMVLERRDKNK